MRNDILISIFLMTIFFVSIVNASALYENSACDDLIEVALSQHLVAEENPDGRYYCIPHLKTEKYFIFQLHYGGGEPKDWIGSDLVGYYAIRKSDGAVLEWDISCDLPIGEIIRNNTQKSEK